MREEGGAGASLGGKKQIGQREEGEQRRVGDRSSNAEKKVLRASVMCYFLNTSHIIFYYTNKNFIYCELLNVRACILLVVIKV
jgi:hypothetical protein